MPDERRIGGEGLYEKVLAGLAEGAVPLELPEERPPRSSASVVPWRRTAAGGLEAWWIRRAAGQRFMGGWYAFPGGGLARSDREIPTAGRPRGLDGVDAAAGLPETLLEGAEGIALGPILAPGLLGCAARELFEETGLLLVPEALAEGPEGRGGMRPELRARLEEGRKRLLEGETRLAPWLAASGLALDLSPLVYGGRWLTPPLGPVRFDNRFFLLEWPAERALQPRPAAGEIDHAEWVDPAAAVARWQRGEVLTAPPILHLLRVLAEDGPEAGLSRMRSPEEANLGPYRKVEFRPGVVLFPQAAPTLPPASHTNAYLLGFGEAILVDPGSPFPREIDRLREALAAAAERLGRRVVAIWLTHHHPDHVGGVEALRRALGVPVLAHGATAARLRERGIEVDGLLADGERVVLAGEPPMPIAVVHTPGHTRGHLSFFDETFGSLIAGDLVAGFGTIVIDPPEGNMDDYLASLRRARALAPRTLFPGHGPTLLDAVGKLDEIADHRIWREGRIREAWEAGLRRPAEMLETVYDDAPRAAWPLAERQILAHLERLGLAG